MTITGRVWIFGDNINTDLIQPGHALISPLEEQPKYVFEANRPGWVDHVQKGDLIVAGRNFGTGSSRPAAQVLRLLGIAGLIAESINGLFFRNCVNYALPALEVPGVSGLFTEGDIGSLDLLTGRVRNVTADTEITGTPWASEVLTILQAGGLLQQLSREGLLVDHE